MKPNVKKILLSLAISLSSLCLTILVLEISYKISLFKINKEIFSPIFAVFLFVALIFQSQPKSNMALAVRGAMAGYLLGIISYFITQLLEPNGLEVITNTFSQYGVLNLPFFLLVLLPSLLSGSWLIGGFAFLLLKISLRSVNSPSR